MSTYQFTNNASTTLGSSVSSSATSITVATGTGNSFPAISGGQFFTATLWANGSATGLPNEIVKVTARSGDTMTVVRGQEGTTAQAWNVGDTFANYPTAGFFNGLADAGAIQTQAGNYAVDTGTANAGVVTLSPVPVSLVALVGVPIRVKKQGAASTGAYTLNVNTLGAVAVNVGGQAMVNGELAGNDVYTVVYNGTAFDLQTGAALVNTQQVAAQAVTNAKLAQMASGTVKANLSGGSAVPADATLAALAAALGLATGADSGASIYVELAVTGIAHPLIIQAGQVAATDSDGNPGLAITFPTAFSTKVSAFLPVPVFATNYYGNDDNVQFGEQFGNRTLSGTLVRYSTGLTGIIYINWFAIGY